MPNFDATKPDKVDLAQPIMCPKHEFTRIYKYLHPDLEEGERQNLMENVWRQAGELPTQSGWILGIDMDYCTTQNPDRMMLAECLHGKDTFRGIKNEAFKKTGSNGLEDFYKMLDDAKQFMMPKS